MNDQEHSRAALTEFYRERLLPLAELARNRGITFFPAGPDADANSYFIDRDAESDYIHSIDPAALADELRKMWSDDELAELADLAEPLAELALLLHDKETAVSEVSPFIYAMF